MITQRYVPILLYAIIMLIGSMLQACCTTTKLQSSSDKPSQLLDLTREPYIAIHAKVNYQAGTSDYTCHVNIHIQRDSLIWFSVTHGWGIELVRGKITLSGIEWINHLEKSYQIYDYPGITLHEQIPCNYNLLQAMLLGELPDTVTKPKVLLVGEETIIQQEQGLWKCWATIHRNTRRLTSLRITGQGSPNQWSVFYDYTKKRKQDFLFCQAKAYFTKFKLNIAYKNVTLSKQPLSFSFKIPEHYDKL